MKREHIARQWLENNGPIYAGCERVQEGYRMLRASDADDWQILATMGDKEYSMLETTACMFRPDRSS
jgi:hypothetical protein